MRGGLGGGLVVPLGGAACAASGRVGWKAARLSRLIEEGFPVPAGVAVTTAAFAQHCARNRIRLDQQPAAVAAAIRDGGLHPALQAALARSAGGLGSGPLAVRSSAVAEDSADGSMAGLLETFLGTPPAGVGRRLRDCWASLYSARVEAYARRPGAAAGPARAPRMGVIVQRQVAARWAGVLFTVDPQRRSGDAMVLEWVEGLGDALVGGAVSPARLRLSRRAAGLRLPGTLPRPLASALEELHAAALRAERLFGEPLDLEWCVGDQGLQLVQVRPVTAFLGPGLCAWSSANVGENYPEALSPLTWSVVDRFRRRYFEALAARLWIPRRSRAALRPLLANLLGVHRGRVHYNLTSWQRMFALVPGGPLLRRCFERYIDQPAPLGTAPGGAVASAPLPAVPRGRMLAGLLFRYAMLDRAVGAFVRRFHRRRAGWRRALGGAPTLCGAAEVTSEILAFLDLEWGEGALADFSAMVFPALLDAAARAWLPPAAAARAGDLLQGLGLKSTEAVKLLYALGRWISARPELRELLRAGRDAGLVQALDGEGLALWLRFLDQFGGRCYQELLLTSPTFEERPELAWQLVRGYLAADAPDPALREREEARAREQLTAELLRLLPLWKRPLFARLLGDAARAIAHREEVRLCQGLLYGELRRAALAVGGGLVAAGRLERDQDVFQLELEELQRLLSGRFLYPETIPALIGARRAAAGRARDGGRGLPGLFVLPLGAGYPQEEAEAGGTDASPPGGDGRSWRGVGASPGRAQGTVRVILDPVEEGRRLRPGDVLVARATDPGWTPLFPIAAAVVLERGGTLSHAAIVARELGIPVVVEVADATRLLRDGQRVSVDGSTGQVALVGSGE